MDIDVLDFNPPTPHACSRTSPGSIRMDPVTVNSAMMMDDNGRMSSGGAASAQAEAPGSELADVPSWLACHQGGERDDTPSAGLQDWVRMDAADGAEWHIDRKTEGPCGSAAAGAELSTEERLAKELQLRRLQPHGAACGSEGSSFVHVVLNGKVRPLLKA
jgi:hypothetical protein